MVYRHTVTTDCSLDTLTEAIERLGYFWLRAEGIPEEGTVYDVSPSGELETLPYDDLCPRCWPAHPLKWVGSSLYCDGCTFKAGCCEGEPQS